MKILRVAIVLVVLTAAVIVYESSSSPPGERDFTQRSADNLAWESERTSVWKNWSYVTADDRQQLGTAVRKALASLPPESLPRDEQHGLSETVTAFLYALSRPTAQEYLDNVQGIRDFPDNPRENARNLLLWKMMTGEPMPDLSFREAFDCFWEQSKPKPKAYSLGEHEGFSLLVGEWDGRRTHWKAEEQREIWMNPASIAFAPITSPLQRLGDPPAVEILLETIARTQDDRFIPIAISLFWSSDRSRWILEFASNQTDENLFWPM